MKFYNTFCNYILLFVDIVIFGDQFVKALNYRVSKLKHLSEPHFMNNIQIKIASAQKV